MGEIRKAVVAGQFYEAVPSLLKKQIISCFLHELGPRKLPVEEKKKKNFVAAIVPHAGYMFSGPCAANAYFELKKYTMKTIILLGPNHTGISSTDFSVSFSNFETPLGIVKNNLGLSKEICEKTQAKHDETPHFQEHSIEVQLPFLQFIYKNFDIVPIVISTSSYEACKKFASELVSTIKKKKTSIAVLASSDFTHFGFHYGFVPFVPNNNLEENLKKFDEKHIKAILALDSKSFYEYAKKTTICGAAPIIVTMEICKAMNKKGRLLQHYTSSRIIKSNNAVGYASIIFE
ncbi:MAG: AmmeMemoRadiSam system protein B [Candidatus Pacearchaeota archaeon]|nr:AmmeMemoRadiSam system protein B [Candidatus Pacearchaeota archaeon]